MATSEGGGEGGLHILICDMAKSWLFVNIYKFLKNRHYFKFHWKILKKTKRWHNSKTFILNVTCPTAIIRSKKNYFFSNFFLEKYSLNIFCFFSSYYVFLRSPYGSTAHNIWLKLQIIKDINYHGEQLFTSRMFKFEL